MPTTYDINVSNSNEEDSNVEPEKVERKRADDQTLIEASKHQSQEADRLGKQQRQNVRVDVRRELTLIVGEYEFTVQSRDISATGVGFITRVPLEIDSLARIVIKFDTWTLDQEIIVKFIKPLILGIQVGAQITELSTEVRENLVKEVFSIQRAQLGNRSVD